MGHKNRKIILPNSKINKDIFKVISGIIINNQAPILLYDLIKNLQYNTRKLNFNKYKNVNQYIKNEYTNIHTFLRLNSLFDIIKKKEILYVDYLEWVELTNPVDDIIDF